MLELARIAVDAGLPRGVLNVVTGLGRRSRRAARDASGRRAHRLHRRRCGGSPHLRARGARAQDGHARARRQVAEHRVRRCGPRARRSRVSCRASSPRPDRAARRARGCCVQRSIHDRFVGNAGRVHARREARRSGAARTRRWGRSQRDRSSRRSCATSTSDARRARRALGGSARPDLGAGWFVEPTIFTGVRNDMRIAQEEIFGPVLAVIPFKDEHDAIRIGNDIRFGLAARRVDQGPAPRDAADRQAAGRHGLGEQLSRDELHQPVRRLQGFRHRPGVGRRRGRRVPARPSACGSRPISTCPNPFVRR